jgi:hypothetical protein
MRNVRQLGLMLVAICAMSIMFSASAGASEFLSSEENGRLTAKALETQTFNTEEGNVECTGLSLLNGTAQKLSVQLHVTLDYKTCKAFGTSATVSPALYLFLANGKVHIQSQITVTGLGGCLVLVPAQTVGTVTYTNVGNEINLTPNVTGIHYTAHSKCLVPGTFTTGTYVGKSLVALASGAGFVKWDA